MCSIMWKVWITLLLTFCIVTFKTTNGNFTQEVKTATNQFSLDLLKKITHNSTDNVVVSPVSVYTLLAILQQGAHGNTRQEIDNVVHAQPEQTKEAYNSLTNRYKDSFGRTELEFNTRAFAGAELDLKSDFKQTLINYFQSGIDSVYFGDSLNASAHINSWVSQATGYKIIELIKPEDIDDLTRLVLVNTIYFKSFWDHPFFQVENKAFNPRSGEEIQVPTLSHVQTYHAGECPHIGAKYVHLDFVDNAAFSVLLVLPTERHGLNAVLNHLTADNLTNIFRHNQYKRVTLQFPKFRLQSDSHLKSVLQSLGINQAFQPTANLSGITLEPVVLSKAIQKAEILADENGVTAAAATGNTYFLPMAVFVPEEEDMEFIANHPFLFFIVDRENHVPLFAGRVTNPSAQ